MPSNPASARLLFLLLLFCGTICSSMIVPFMGFFLVDGLGYEPWVISVYSVLALSLTLFANRQFARRIDGGAPVFPLVGIAIAGFLAATLSLSALPTIWMVMTIGAVGFGIGSSAVSTMFSLGGSMAERHEIARSRFNAYMRATTSTAWMIGPAVSFLIADQIGLRAVFMLSFIVALIWLTLWWTTLPRDIAAGVKEVPGSDISQASASRQLWLAAGFVFCLSLAHSLTFTSLPVFYVQEVGLPGYAPGLAFSIKTFVEVFAIFSTPLIISRFGMRPALIATTLLAVITIQLLAAVQTFPQMLGAAALEGLYYGLYASLGISYVQSFATDRPAQATAMYWNTLMITGLLAGPAVGLIAQVYDFRTVVHTASGVALVAAAILVASRAPSKAG